MAEFGALLSELRKDFNLSQAELGEIIFVSSSTISNYESGVHSPDIGKLVSLADYFGVTTDYILGRTSESISLEMLETKVAGNTNVAALVKAICEMTPERQRALTLIVDDMRRLSAATTARFDGKVT